MFQKNIALRVDSVSSATTYYDALGSDMMLHANPVRTDAEVKYISSLLSEHSVVLDAGCGYARIAKALLAKGFDVYGCDVSAKMISLCGDENRFIRADICNLPYPDKAFTHVLCLWSTFNSLLSQEDQVRALRELRRVCTQTVFLDMPDGGDYMHKLLRYSRGVGEHKRLVENYFAGPPNIVYVHDEGSVRIISKKSGFSSCSVQKDYFGKRLRMLVRLRV